MPAPPRQPPRPESTGGLPDRSHHGSAERSRTSIGERTMFFMPLAYPSTLDRRLSSCRASSYVEELWSPILLAGLEMRRLKLTLIRRWISQHAAAEIFLSQAGPRFRFRTVSS